MKRNPRDSCSTIVIKPMQSLKCDIVITITLYKVITNTVKYDINNVTH